MEENKEDESLKKLMKLTKLMKEENVKVAPKGPPKAANKWRGRDPKFSPKTEKPVESVDVGGMQVDPARKEEYENWRKDKLEEQNDRRAAAARKAKAAEDARKASPESTLLDPPESLAP